MKATAKLFIFVIFFITVIFAFSTSVFAADITNYWSATTSIRAGAGLVSFSSSNKAYVVGGSAVTGNSYSEIISNTPGSNGQLDSWTSEGNFSTALIFHTIARRGNDIYILGGREENSGSVNDFVNKVFLGKLDNSGNLGSWVQQTSFPVKSALGAAAIVGDRIYYAGGFNPGYSNKIYSALISPDGSLGSWIDAGNLPAAQIGFSMIEHNGHLIIIGGDNSALTYKTTPDASGHISGWDATTSFPMPIYRASAVKVDSTLLIIGGYDGSTTTNNIYFTTIHDDGTLDPSWTLSSNHLPLPVHGGSAAVVGQYLYLMGGYNGSYLSSVYFTKLNIEVSPTPTPTDINLQVPLIKQIDSAWGSQIYDTANIWSPSKPGISDWGCALTSAAMVFNYHGITKLPDGTALNPGTLNAWMNGRPKGYIGGSVNWMELQKLSKLAKLKNSSFAFDALEFKKVYSYDPVQLRQDLQDNIPGIIEVDNHQHFLVAKGTSGNTFSINDPFYNVSLLTQAHGNTFTSLGRFVPSHSDLSYMELAVNDGVSIIVKDQNGVVVGQGFTQQPSNPGGTNKGTPINFYYVPQPSSGAYTITLTSSTTKTYGLQTLLYDIDGNLAYKDTNGILGNYSEDNFSVKFNKAGNESGSISKNYSFDSLILDLDLLYGQKLIRFGIYTAMKAEVLAAKKLSLKSKVSARAILLAVSKELDSFRGKSITEKAYQILKPEVVALRGTL